MFHFSCKNWTQTLCFFFLSLQDNQKNDDECCVCRESGKLVMCDNCPRSFHQQCHLPHVEDATVKWAEFSESHKYCGYCNTCWHFVRVHSVVERIIVLRVWMLEMITFNIVIFNPRTPPHSPQRNSHMDVYFLYSQSGLATASWAGNGRSHVSLCFISNVGEETAPHLCQCHSLCPLSNLLLFFNTRNVSVSSCVCSPLRKCEHLL